ncbi:PilZ domain-containing protein [Pelomonas sp. P8]|uniref:PilZ domain-containing protein n=1 Tax=Pelomonas cellulosilytica TaxID=2906762 RepID=A0ABS8XYR7_9BURK|nr:PilZ domain-containing protein [Pelomonas sp. P8]
MTTDARLPVKVIDISLNGALLQLPAGAAVPVGRPCLVRLPLGSDADGIVIEMGGELAHVEGPHAGVQCRTIDLESITHLRRLLEVNLGDPEASERELKALIAAARGG